MAPQLNTQKHPAAGSARRGVSLSLRFSERFSFIFRPEQAQMGEALIQAVPLHIAGHIVGHGLDLRSAAAHGHPNLTEFQHGDVHLGVPEGDGIPPLCPEVGQQVEGDATVTLYIAQASIKNKVVLTSTTGLSVEEARAELGRLNVTPQEVQMNSDQPVGTVLNMYPSAGTEVRIGSRVILYVSSGVPEVVATPEPVINGDPNTVIK